MPAWHQIAWRHALPFTMVEEQFRNTTIADVLAEPGAVTPLCQEQKTVMIQANLSGLKKTTEEKTAEK